MLEIRGLFFKYGEQWTLEYMSFEGLKGELIAVVGPSGAGKSTLMKLIVGILEPYYGSIIINNQEVTKLPIEKRNIGYVPQDPALFPHLSVYDNIAFGMQAQHWDKEKQQNRVNELARLGNIKELLNKQPHTLSGGEKQRVALLRALATRPLLLLLDEPLANLDTILRENLAIYIRNIQRLLGTTTLFITHDINEAKMLADKIVVLNNGRIMQIGTTRQLTLNPQSVEVAVALGLKNVYSVYSMKFTNNNSKIILSTEIGVLFAPTQIVENIGTIIEAIHINPTKVTLHTSELTGTNILRGEILAVIPDPMIHQSTIIIKIIKNKIDSKMNDGDVQFIKNNIIRVQSPISETKFNSSDLVYLNIKMDSIRLFESN